MNEVEAAKAYKPLIELFAAEGVVRQNQLQILAATVRAVGMAEGEDLADLPAKVRALREERDRLALEVVEQLATLGSTRTERDAIGRELMRLQGERVLQEEAAAREAMRPGAAIFPMGSDVAP